MTTIQSPKTIINKPVTEVYAFLKDLKNHAQLLPENLYNWEATEDKAKFTIQNMAKLEIEVAERIENKKVKCVAIGDAPFAVELQWDINEAGANTEAQMTINADLNMMLQMIAKGPLQKVVEFQAEKLKEVLS